MLRDAVQVLGIVDDAFMAGAQRHTVKLVMKRLKATQGRLREVPKPKVSLRYGRFALPMHAHQGHGKGEILQRCAPYTFAN